MFPSWVLKCLTPIYTWMWVHMHTHIHSWTWPKCFEFVLLYFINQRCWQISIFCVFSVVGLLSKEKDQTGCKPGVQMWLFRKTHSWGWLLYVLVAKIHSSVFNLAPLHHPHPCLISNGHHCGWLWYWNRKKEKPWEYMLAPQQAGEVVSNAIHYRRSTPFHIQVISARCIVSKTLTIYKSVAIILVIWVSGRTDIMSILII